MRILLFAIKAYIWLVVIWAIMTWIPGVAGSPVHNIVGTPVVPVLNLLSFATVGFIGLQAIIVIVILWLVESWLEKLIKRQEGGTAVAESGVDQERDLPE